MSWEQRRSDRLRCLTFLQFTYIIVASGCALGHWAMKATHTNLHAHTHNLRRLFYLTCSPRITCVTAQRDGHLSPCLIVLISS